jgi:hypothetical protein
MASTKTLFSVILRGCLPLSPMPAATDALSKDFQYRPCQAGPDEGAGTYLDAAFSISSHSFSESFKLAAATFSSKCFTEEVPGIGSITGDL